MCDSEGQCHSVAMKPIMRFHGVKHISQRIPRKGIHVTLPNSNSLHGGAVPSMRESKHGVPDEANDYYPGNMALIVLVGVERVIVHVAEQQGGVRVELDILPECVFPEGAQ